MKQIFWAFVPVLILGAASPSAAARSKSDAKTVAAAVETAAEAEAPAAPCIAEKKEKKKSGLGGLLRAARNSGLLNVVAGHTGAGAVVSSVANTAIDVAAADTSARAAVPEREMPKC